ncbi:uncharacterized protein LOC102460244 isoform X3 [Pelodiscus sinensis]|uniref:uncharacterized protein LOC102460244 isoform X3 n=1 Tax=Pelodiscus sinensis TaxID=13735 RepID=UPI003F6CC2B8
MLDSAVRLALGAGQLVAPGPQLSEHLALLQAQVLASLWPILLLGGTVALLVLLGMLRHWGRTRSGPQLGAVGEEDGAGAASCKAGRLPSPAQQTHNGTAGHGQQEQTARQSHMAKVPVNGHLLTCVGMREKKLLKSKKKKKIQSSEKGASKDHFFTEKDKLPEEEEGVWQTKISSREKRHLRKERLKQKENPSRASPGTLMVEAVCDGDWKLTIGPHAVSGMEDNSSSGKGTHCESGAKTDDGSAVRNSEATREEFEPTQSEEDVFTNVDDPLAADLNSDWNAPTEEWGNWLGEEDTCTGPEREKQGLKMRTEDVSSELIFMKHSRNAICPSFKILQDPFNNLPHNDVPVKKERRKRKKMRKET